jgi:hypothetical protein
VSIYRSVPTRSDGMVSSLSIAVPVFSGHICFEIAEYKHKNSINCVPLLHIALYLGFRLQLHRGDTSLGVIVGL